MSNTKRIVRRIFRIVLLPILIALVFFYWLFAEKLTFKQAIKEVWEDLG